VEDIDFGVDFVVGNSNKLQELGLERKNHLSLHCVHIGPMEQATLMFSYQIIFTNMLVPLWNSLAHN